MSSLLRPVGHLPASVYWVRRALLLAVLVVLLVLLLRLLGGGGDDPKNSAATGPGQTPSPGATVVPTSTPSSTASRTGKTTGDGTSEPVRSESTKSEPVKSESVKSEPPRDLECAGDDVRISVLPANRSVQPGASLSLAIRLSAVDAECKATVDPTKLSLTITSGMDPIWTTTHCEQAIPRATLVLAKGKESTSTVLWNGRRSGPGCLPGQPQAKPGTYVATAVYDGRPATPQAFYVV